ncbi:MAG: alanine racemase [Gammaproteobacteria bacterium]|nr:alanine racemase [Gammaproteobacteria bacterium]
MRELIRALIDVSALNSNLRVLRRAAPRSKVMAVIKANAYGHGLINIAQALPSADAFAVARLDEALELRAAGITQPIVLLEGAFDAMQLASAALANLEIVVHDLSQVASLEHFSGTHQFIVWLKVDTGMNRLGFRPEQILSVQQRLCNLQRPLRELRMMTHLACADELESDMTAHQLQCFERVLGPLSTTLGSKPVTSIGNSAGALFWPNAQGDWIRPGLALYGVSPSASREGDSLGLLPVMTFQTTVIATRQVAVGESVGYGASWRATRATRLAILAAGYGDGVPRHLPSGAPVLICASGATTAQRAPLVGRVSMDMIAVDVTELPAVHVGSCAQLWGPGLKVEEVAAAAQSIPYELLCGLSHRVPLKD